VNSKVGPVTVVGMAGLEEQADDVAAFLASDPALASRLPEIEERVLHHFGPGTRAERTVFHPYDEEDAPDEFHLRVITDMTIDERIDRLKALLDEERELLAPFRSRLTIGIL
jgi:hypothetical protein